MLVKKARKKHKCDNCGGNIEIGENYQIDKFKTKGFYCWIIEDYISPKTEISKTHLTTERCREEIERITFEFYNL